MERADEHAGKAAASPWWARHAPVVLAMVPYLALALWHWPYLPGIHNGDYAQYLLHAKAIVEGRSYGDTGYLFTSLNPLVSPALQPPGWPLLLTPGVAMFGTGFLYAKVLSLVACLVFLGGAARRLGAGDQRWMAAGAAALTGVSLESGFATNSVLSDLPFAACIWAFVLVADREGPWSWRRVVLLLALGTFAISVRVVGLAVVPAIGLLALLRRGRDRTRMLALFGAWVGAGAILVLAVGAGRVPFLTQALRSPDVMLRRIGARWSYYKLGPVQAVMYPFSSNLANDLYHAAALGLMVIGSVAFLRKFGRTALGTFTLAYLLLLLASPTSDVRYLWPAFPVFAWCMLAGARTIVSFRPILRLRLGTALVPGLVALVVVGTVTAWRQPAPPALLNRADVQDLFAWLRSERDRSDIRVVFSRERVLTLETGVPAMATFRSPPDRAFEELDRKGITHVIVGDAGIGANATEAFEQFVREHQREFAPVYSNSGFTVYAYRRRGGESSS